MDNQDKNSDIQPSQNPEITNQPEAQSTQSRPAEKVIQPLTSALSPSDATPKVVTSPSGNNNDVSASSYDPSSDGHEYKVPSLHAIKTTDENSAKTVAKKHKSLLVLSILGLLGTVFAIYSALLINHAIHNAQLTNAGSSTGGAQGDLDILYASIVFNVSIYTYLLLAKDSHTVSTVLKVLLVLEFINVFGAFWGNSPGEAASLVIDFVYLIYTYIVFNIVKT